MASKRKQIKLQNHHIIEVQYTVIDLDTREYPSHFIFDTLPYQIGKVSILTPYEGVVSRML